MPTVVVADGLAVTLRTQAETMVSAVAQAGPMATAHPALSESLEGFPGADLVPRSLLAMAARVLARGTLARPDGPVMELQEPVRFTLHEGGFASVVFSSRPTVGLALVAVGSSFSRYDQVWPAPDTPLTEGLHVFVQRATAVSLSVGSGRPATVHTHSNTVAELLAEQGVKLGNGDSVTPGPAVALIDGMTVAVTVVRSVTEGEDTPIPFETYYRDDSSRPEGEYAELQAGVDGYVRREYSVTFQDGVEVGRVVLSETVVQPDNRIIAQGTAAVAAAVAAPAGDPQCGRTLRVWATWYTAASAGGGSTATGTTVRKGTVAVDPRVIPLGTQMYIPGYGYGVAEDTGGAVIGNIIDLGYGAGDVKDWQSGWVAICVLN
ncbi:MAG: G5 domain-containing protein [Dehalococcoidia bacterium]|nr:G5 domain-containing protein [Dehalococcoidia bacterium]